MENLLIYIAVAIISIGVGFMISKLALRKSAMKQSDALLEASREKLKEAKEKMEEAKEKAEIIKKEKILQAKEKFFQLKSEHEKIIGDRNTKIQVAENRIRQKESTLSNKIEEAQRQQKESEALKGNLNRQLEILNLKQVEVDKMHKTQVEKLETISNLSAEEAESELIESLKDEAKSGPWFMLRK